MRVIISIPERTFLVFLLSYILALMATPIDSEREGNAVASANRILVEQPIGDEKAIGGKRRAARSVTVNQAESPLGWLLSRGHLSRRQYDAGERLRLDYERSAIAPRVTMGWDSVPVARSRGGKSSGPEVTLAMIDARRRFDRSHRRGR